MTYLRDFHNLRRKECGIEQAYNDGMLDWKKPVSCHLFPIRTKKSRDGKTEYVNYEPREDLCAAACKLGKRLNADGTPKQWSKPVNRVDDAAYRHDLAYASTADRNAADRKMIKELDNISNPTLRERMERAIVRPILKTKVNFGI